MKITIDSRELEKVADQATKHLLRSAEIATQRALLGTAKAVQKAEVSEMSRVFKSPTRFTLNALTIKLDKPRMEARVEVKDGYWSRADNYLETQVAGAGMRRQKAFEKALQAVGVLPAGWVAVPGKKAKLNAYGNQSAGEIRQILSWFDAAERVAGSTQNMRSAGRDRRRQGTKKKAGWEYFVARPGARRTFVRETTFKGTHGMQPGIYRRTSYSLGSRIEPVVIFVRKASYAKRFDFYGIGRETTNREFKHLFDAAMQQEMAKLGWR